MKSFHPQLKSSKKRVKKWHQLIDVKYVKWLFLATKSIVLRVDDIERGESKMARYLTGLEGYFVYKYYVGGQPAYRSKKVLGISLCNCKPKCKECKEGCLECQICFTCKRHLLNEDDGFQLYQYPAKYFCHGIKCAKTFLEKRKNFKVLKEFLSWNKRRHKCI